MIRIITIIIAVALTSATTGQLQAQCDSCDSGCAACATTCCSAPQCQAAGRCCGGPRCVGKAEWVDVEEHCWKIECEDICVPAVRFPWEHGGNKLTLFSLFRCKKSCGKSGCTDVSCDGGCSAAPTCGCAGPCQGCADCVPPKCGFIVKVRDLKKETYETKACEYSIELVDPNANGCCVQPGCTTPGCAKNKPLAPQATQHAKQKPVRQHQVPPLPQPVSTGKRKAKIGFASLKRGLLQLQSGE